MKLQPVISTIRTVASFAARTIVARAFGLLTPEDVAGLRHKVELLSAELAAKSTEVYAVTVELDAALDRADDLQGACTGIIAGGYQRVNCPGEAVIACFGCGQETEHPHQMGCPVAIAEDAVCRHAIEQAKTGQSKGDA